MARSGAAGRGAGPRAGAPAAAAGAPIRDPGARPASDAAPGVRGALVGALREELVVTGLGYAAFDVYAAGDRARNFYLSGALGSAAAVAFGLAGARPADRVVCVDGEGSLLANLGVLATIGRYAAPQPDLRGAGQRDVPDHGRAGDAHRVGHRPGARRHRLRDRERAHGGARSEDFRAAFETMLRTPGPHCLVAKVDRQRSAGYQPRKGVLLKYRFMGALGTHPDVGALAWE